MVPEDKTSGIIYTAVAYFENLTWGDLRNLVALGQREGCQDHELVDLYYENEDYYSPVGLKVSFKAKGDL